MSKDWGKIVGDTGNNQYEERLKALKKECMHTASIEQTVEKTVKNLKNARSLVIFGEPQSGKTEMMIALNARLLDEGYRIIINLVTDSIDLLDQNLMRFRKTGLNPSPQSFDQLSEDAGGLKGQESVIFCKKNARNLERLIESLRLKSGFVIIDDEADYASPDGNINRPEHDKTKINGLISQLLAKDGTYIGVTATPARLDLNDTFENESEQWVDFKPHPEYVGQDFFFPHDGKCDYCLRTFKADEGDERNEIEKAILHFLCGVAELHSIGKKENFTMLVHTSGRKHEHAEDVAIVKSTMSTLSDSKHSSFERLRKKLWKIAEEYDGDGPDSIGEFVLRNIRKQHPVEINSANPKPGKVAEIAEPTSLFSFGIGGNIISRGVTFNNLLSMYFTRSVKGKFTQDTYIQRARMFGTRADYKEKFQLWITEDLMENWNKCFTFHKLALDALRSDTGAPVWLSDHKVMPTAAGSINKSSVDFEGGEMSFALFDFNGDNKERIAALFNRNGRDDIEVLSELREFFADKAFPLYVNDYMKTGIYPGSKMISFHKPSPFGIESKSYTAEEKRTIRRKKKIFGTNYYRSSELPNAQHHLKVFYNEMGEARLFYKIKWGAVKFIQRRR